MGFGHALRHTKGGLLICFIKIPYAKVIRGQILHWMEC